MSSLYTLAMTAPVIPTFSAHDLRAAANVRDAYLWHASTYVEQPALAALRQSFADAVAQARTPKACLIAPFGYGKTASAIGLWHACSQAHLLVVPPVTCRSFTELASAIQSWLTFVLPDVAPSLRQVHEQFLVSSAESLARHDEQAFGIPFEQAMTAIRDKLERGYLDFDDVSVNLLAFIEQATTLVQQAGYRGLVVIIDEFQQFLGNAHKGVLTALRQLIWGLRVRKLPFGLVLTMDPDTERTLSDRAGDILHRIKDDGFYVDIRRIYNCDFPAQLWQRYTTALALSPEDQHAIDRTTLEALGQLCERDDLSNGPRTVINVLQRAAERWITQQPAPYTPIDLIDDFLTGIIRFDGNRSVVSALVAELLGFPYFQRSRERTAVLKLIAAFPRGCPAQVARRYGLEAAWHELNDDLRGEIVTETDEGLALIELQRVGRPADRLNVLLRRYWMQITDQQLFAEDSVRIFRDTVIPLLFPARVHDLSGWSGVAEIEMTADHTYAGIIEGTASTAFPLRRIAVSIQSAALAKQFFASVDDVDLHLAFVVHVHPDADSSVTIESGGTRTLITLALGRTADQQLSASIGWIAHYLNPHPISPAVVLNLLRYLGREPRETLPERDRARIEDTMARLQEWTLSTLFPPSLFRSAGIQVLSSGADALREFCFQVFRQRWPDYQPLARLPSWTSMLAVYKRVLSRVAPTARVGQEPISGSKNHIAALFEQRRHAGFDSYVRQYGSLVQIEKWQGDETAIRLLPHTAEFRIAEQVRRQGACQAHTVYAALRQEGFAAAEASQIIELAIARSLITCEGAHLTVPTIPSIPAIERRLHDLRQRVQKLNNLPAHLGALLADLTETEHPAAAAWRLDQAEQQIDDLERRAIAAMKAYHEEIQRRIMQYLPQLEQDLPIPPAGPIEKHLMAACRKLTQERDQLKQPAWEYVKNPTSAPSQHVVETLVVNLEHWAKQLRFYADWVRFARAFAALQSAVRRIDSGSSALEQLRDACDQLGREARAVQAECGLKGLAEIDRLQARLHELSRQFDALVDDRRAAYHHTAATLAESIAHLLDLPTNLSVPVYQSDDEAQSYCALRRSIAATIRRAVALLEICLVDYPQASAQEKRDAGTLRRRIRAIVRLTRDPDKLFNNDLLSIRPQVAEQIRTVRQQVATFGSSDPDGAHTRSRLVAALSDLPAGPVAITAVLKRVGGEISRDEALNELLQLHECGLLRLVIDLPEPGDARNYSK